MFIETSARAGYNIRTLFRELAQALPGVENQNHGQQLVDIQLKGSSEDVKEDTRKCQC